MVENPINELLFGLAERIVIHIKKISGICFTNGFWGRVGYGMRSMRTLRSVHRVFDEIEV